jgi:hypothetical protein
MEPVPDVPTAFDEQTRKLGLNEQNCVASEELRRWCLSSVRSGHFIPQPDHDFPSVPCPTTVADRNPQDELFVGSRRNTSACWINKLHQFMPDGLGNMGRGKLA